MLRSWDATSGRELLTLAGPMQMTSVVFSPDGQRIVAASTDMVKLWDATTGQEALSLRGSTGERPEDIAFNARVVFSHLRP